MTSFKHQFLLAMPNLVDPNFAQGLTYICEHSDTGTLGLVVNKPLDLSFAELVNQIGIPLTSTEYATQPIYAGGPVHSDRGFVLHTGEASWNSSMYLGEGLHLTTSLDILEALAAGEGPEDFIIALGCASWEVGQLEDEMLVNAWLNCPANLEVMFNTPYEERLDAAALTLGIEFNQLTSAGNA